MRAPSSLPSPSLSFLTEIPADVGLLWPKRDKGQRIEKVGAARYMYLPIWVVGAVDTSIDG
jgi:hypothetical protein